MRWLIKTLLISLFLLSAYFLLADKAVVLADRLTELQTQIDQYQKEIDRLKVQQNTLNNQIAQFDAQIKLTELKISQTEEKINLLGGRIDSLEVSLQSLTSAFSRRAVETYKMARAGDPLFFVITSDDLSEAVSRFHYLQRIQVADRDLLIRLQKAQDTYKEQKTSLEQLQEELEQQRSNLNSQKAAKNNLLQLTRNDEKKYQQLLAAVRAEYEAIQAILAGKGTETEIGHVNEGERIASIIQGGSCNSGGTHTHFIVRKPDRTTDNPFNYLQSGIDFDNCSGSSCGSSDGDPFNPSGGWTWPVNPKIKFTQGYGYTWAVQNTWVGRIYNFHNGIDINSYAGSEVKAVRSGTLYRGSYNVGCTLRYVRVDHDDSDLDTLYLHVNY
ncbi:hypothetical protein HYT59_02150 [Candidatus Woesebacteria bacterium]|nr:hypothetical protein [Candidatus Woesebacteria bacterium]